MKSNKKFSVLIAAGLALTMGLTGCGSTQSASGSATKVSTAKPGQPLVIVPTPQGSFQENFNPFALSANYGTTGLIYEPLFYFDSQTGKKFPFLGKSMTWSNNNTTLTVQINTDAKWSDGKPFTANDVAYTFDVLKKYPAVDRNGVWTQLSDAKAQGDGTVEFQFKQPNVPFAMYVLQTYIVPEHIWKSIADPDKATITKPVGTGAYVLDTFTSQDYKLKANSNYYNGKPGVSELSFPAYNGNDSANLALVNGTIDLSATFIPNIDKAYVAKKSTNNYWFPPTSVFNLLTNLKDPILGQKVVRQAISMAIDRDSLSKKAEYGYMTPATPNQIVPSASKDWADPSLTASDKKFTYDPDGAKKLLEQAGFKENGSGVMVSPDGKPLKFDLISVSGWTDWNAQASIIADNLKKIGIEVNVEQLQHGAFQSKLQSHSFQLAFGGPNPGPNPYYHFDSLYRTNGAVNYEQYSNAQLDQALSEFSKTTDASAQKQAIYTAQKSIAEDLPTIPLLNAEVLYEYSTAKYTGWPDAKNPYVSPSVWNYPAMSIMLQHLKPVSK